MSKGVGSARRGRVGAGLLVVGVVAAMLAIMPPTMAVLPVFNLGLEIQTTCPEESAPSLYVYFTCSGEGCGGVQGRLQWSNYSSGPWSDLVAAGAFPRTYGTAGPPIVPGAWPTAYPTIYLRAQYQIGSGEWETQVTHNSTCPHKHITVTKVLAGDGPKHCEDFLFRVDGDSGRLFNASCINDLEVVAGPHNVTEPAVADYATGYTNCTGIVGDDGPPEGVSGLERNSGYVPPTCTITNTYTPPPSLTIVKAATPADDTPFEFVCSLTGVPDDVIESQYTAAGVVDGCGFELRDPSDNTEGLDLAPMTLTELVPDGWRLDGISCDGDPAFWDAEGNTLFVHGDCSEDGFLRAGQICRMPLALTCTFHNSAYGRIVVKKVVPEDAPLATFSFSPSWSGVFSMAGGASSMPFEVPAGVHSVAEVGLPAGWSLASASCDDGSSPAAIGVSPGELVTCTFVNRFAEEGGSLTVIKRTTPAGGAGFAFDGTLGAFSLDDGGVKVFEDLAAGAYAVTESAAEGWEFEDVTCFGAAGEVVDFTGDGASVTVNLAEGQDVTCKFANREEGTSGPEGSLTILKHTVPAGGTGFAFEGGVLGAFSLDDGGTRTFIDLAAGAYTVAESPAEGWEFASITCDALDYVVDGASVTVNLAEGEAAVCTFTNGELPYTGSSLWLPLLLGGLAVLLMGLGAWTFSWIRQADKT